MKKTACVFYMDEKYKLKRPFYAKNSVESFKKWHPDVEVFVIGEETPDDISVDRLNFAKQKFKDGFEKVIMLGADTITCSRFDEFFEDDSTPFLATLDSKMPWGIKFEMQPYFSPQHGILEWPQINSDVSCFNNPDVIDEILKYVDSKNEWFDQIAMSYLYTKRKDLVRIVDFPYTFALSVYNNRAKGDIGADCIKKGKFYFGFDGPKIGEFTPIQVWKPIGDKLYNHEGKQVKAFHFCYHDKDEDPKKWFNEDTINFFVNHCKCEWELPIMIDSNI